MLVFSRFVKHTDELMVLGSAFLIAGTMLLVGAITFGADQSTSLILFNQNLSQWFGFLLFAFVAILIPRKISRVRQSQQIGGEEKQEDEEQEKEKTMVSLDTTYFEVQQRMFECMNERQTLSAFMDHCRDEFCSENLLALVELREFKRGIRKTLGFKGDDVSDGLRLNEDLFHQLCVEILYVVL